ncbi:MAG: hypothetical protein HRF49_10930 [bacterium]|jgi:hypothetical protein
MAKIKGFDCIEMKRKASLKLHEELSCLSGSERKAFWDEILRRMISERDRDRAAHAKSEAKRPAASGKN